MSFVGRRGYGYIHYDSEKKDAVEIGGKILFDL